MTPIEIIFVVAGLAALVLCIIALGRALERRHARKLAASMVGQKCPSCGTSFRKDLLRNAEWNDGFEDSYVSVVCPDCKKRWLLLDGKLV